MSFERLRKITWEPRADGSLAGILEGNQNPSFWIHDTMFNTEWLTFISGFGDGKTRSGTAKSVHAAKLKCVKMLKDEVETAKKRLNNLVVTR